MRRILLPLAGMMLLASALSLPAAASATTPVWTKNHAKLTGLHGVTFNGAMEFVNHKGEDGIDCAEVEFHAFLEPTLPGGWIEKFTTDTKRCNGFGLYDECTVGSHELTGKPTIEATAKTDINVTWVELYTGLVGNCPFTEVEVTIPELTLTPKDPTTMFTLNISGTGTVHSRTIFGYLTTEDVTMKGFVSLQGGYGIGHECERKLSEAASPGYASTLQRQGAAAFGPGDQFVRGLLRGNKA